MKAEILQDNKKNDWNQFVIESKGSFLQSFEWFKFQEMCGNKAWQIRVMKDQKKVLAQAVLIKEKLALGKSFLYVPYGPVFLRELSEDGQEKAFQLFFEKIKTLARIEKAIFLRIEPYAKIFLPPAINYQKPVKRTQPQKTLIIDLEKPEKEILASFEKNARYNIGLAKRKGVRILIKDEYDNVFYDLLQKTAQTNEFKPFEPSHYQNLFKIKSSDFDVKLFLADCKGKTIAGYILVLFSDTATCLHGALDRDYKKLKPANLAVWQRLSFAKAKGFKKFDLWGIDEKRWPGFTNFKKGFGGREVLYPQGIEIVFNPLLYQGYKFLRKLL